MLTKIVKGQLLLPKLPKFNKSPESNIVKKPYPQYSQCNNAGLKVNLNKFLSAIPNVHLQSGVESRERGAKCFEGFTLCSYLYRVDLKRT